MTDPVPVARPAPGSPTTRSVRAGTHGSSQETVGGIAVSWRDAAFGYADRGVVSGVTLDVPAGQILAVLGANGSGKSTLVKGLVGLSDLQGGQVEVFGRPLAASREPGLVGYVPQRHTVIAHDRSTVREIVSVGRLPYLPWHGRLTRKDRQAVTEALDFVGLADEADSPVAALSGGQQRRVLIARALVSQPRLLIMDEPTAGVDETSQAGLVAVMGQLAGQGRTLIVVTHELTAIRAVVHRAVVLSSGRVVFDGAPDDLPPSASHDDHHLHRDDPRLPGSAGPLDHRSAGVT